WYSYYFPEASEFIPDNELFLKYVHMKKKDAMKEFGIKKSMGPDKEQSFVEPMQSLAKEIKSLYKQREEKEIYLGTLMDRICPNVKAIAGTLIGAKLLSIAGSLRKLMLFPASTVQLLGAEEALFKHIKTGARCPKYGVLFAHQLVQKADKDRRGRAARVIADKISLASKVDFFKGEFIGDKLLKEVEKKLAN
ncbi:Pre-mRNA processing ribonucleoprotein, partial [archaeon]|nr:Pre-mRNA processing ribonucleoprotein [archaeon]